MPILDGLMHNTHIQQHVLSGNFRKFSINILDLLRSSNTIMHFFPTPRTLQKIRFLLDMLTDFKPACLQEYI